MLVIRCRRLMWSAAARRLEEAGESLHLYRLLSELARNGPAPQRNLADATAQHAAAISRLVDELEGSGLIRRRRGYSDRRQIIVAITPAGRRRYEAARPLVSAAIEEVMTPLARRQRRRLAELLTVLLDAYVEGGPNGSAPAATALPGRRRQSGRGPARRRPREAARRPR